MENHTLSKQTSTCIRRLYRYVRVLAWAVCISLGLSAPSAMALFGENSRFAMDVSTRIANNFRSDNVDAFVFAGIDGHKVFSSTGGDVATLLVQVYAAKLDDVEGHPPFFSDENDTEITYRNVYLNVKGPGSGQLNFKVGHFEVPFGVEQVMNTNGTLHDYQHGSNLGVKADWGASLNGQTPHFEYEVAWQRGSGNEWETRGDPGIVAGRIGTPRSRAISVGASALRGDVYRYQQPDVPVERTRYALDAIFGWRLFEFRGEYSWGDDFGQSVRNVLLEAEKSSIDTTRLYYLQLRLQQRDKPQSEDHAASLNLGMKYEPDNNLALSLELAYDLHTLDGIAARNLLRVQARYRF